MHTNLLVFCLLASFFLVGCAKHALFITSTSVAIDADAKVPKLSIGYDRLEGFIGPKYLDGSIPPVVAIIKSDGKLLNPQIHQLYATGNAANIITNQGHQPSDCSSCTTGDPMVKPMLFGTSTTSGFKIGFDAASKVVPTEVIFGFKRQEISYIPLKSAQTYGSVLAFIKSYRKQESGQTNPENLGNGLGNNFEFKDVQYFSTGQAAENLAAENRIKTIFKEEASTAARSFLTSQNQQIALIEEAVTCLNRVKVENMEAVFTDAIKMGLIDDQVHLDDRAELSLLEIITSRLKTIIETNGTAQDKLARLYENFVYEGEDLSGPIITYKKVLFSTAGDNQNFGNKLKVHKEFVCGLSE